MSSNKKPKPHYLGHRRRIKDRFLKDGLQPFQDYEALELLLTYAIHQKDLKPIAKNLIARFETFQGVLEAPIEELVKVDGVGEHSALLLKLTRACSDFYLKGKARKKDIISSPKDLLNYCRSSMAYLGDEQFKVIYLNSKNEIINEVVAQEGTVDQTAVYPRKIIERALKEKAVALIFVHNHPSGNPTPSAHDKNLTKTLMKAADPLGIKVHDHIIIGKNGYFSFKEEELI